MPMSTRKPAEIGFSFLKTYGMNLKEIETVLEEIEKNSQIISKDSLLDSKNKEDVFYDEGENLVLKGDYLKKLEKEKKEATEFDVLFSLLSVDSKDGNRYQLVSVDKYDNVYVNFKLLKNLTFNEYYYTYLHNLKSENYTLSNVLNVIFRGFLPYAQDYFKQHYGNVFERYPIFRRIEILTMLFEMTNNYAGELSDRVYVYYLDKYKAFEKLGEDSVLLRKKIPSLEGANLLFLKENLPIRNFSYFRFKTEIPSSIEEINSKTGLSYYQSVILNGFSYSNEYVLGLAGSGKTYLASTIAKIFLLFKAIYFANERKGLPIHYVSFSKESVLKSFIPKIKELAIYFEKNGDVSINAFNSLLSSMNDSYFSEEDMEKLKKLDAVFRNKKEIYEIIKKVFEENEKYSNAFEKLLTKEEAAALYKIVKILEEKKQNMPLSVKLKVFLSKITGKKEIGEGVRIPKKLIDATKRLIDTKKIKNVDYAEIDAILKECEKTYKKLLKEHIETSKVFEEKEIERETTEINVDEIDYENVFFYVKNMWRLLPESDIERVKSSIQKMIYKNDEKLTVEDYDNINKAVPVIAMPVDEIFNIPIESKAFVTLIDESLLINQFLYYSLFGRTMIAYSFGDVNQLSLSFLYNKSALFEKIKKIYEEGGIKSQDEILRKNLFLNEKYVIASVWDAVFKMSPNVNILIDNFRNVRALVKTLIKANPTYVSYIRQFVMKNENVLLPEVKEKIERAKNVEDIIEAVNVFNGEIVEFKNFKGESTFSPLIVFNERGFKDRKEVIRSLLELLSIQDFSIKDVLFVSVFKQDVVGLKKDVEEVFFDSFDFEIDVLPADKIQALEYDVVVLFLEDSNSRNYLIENDKLLNVIISRARKGFIAVVDEVFIEGSVLADFFEENEFKRISYYN